MGAWTSNRWRAIVAGGVVVALVVGAGVWAAITFVNPFGDAVDCSVRQVASFDEAAPIASECAVDVEVLDERTPWQSSWATSEGVSRLDVAAVPTQVEVDGEWVDVDPTIADPTVPEADLSAAASESKMLSVVAPVFPMELNPGGLQGRGEPLGTIERDGHKLSVWFPIQLPEPTLSDTQAIYELAEGVRLLVSISVDATGFLPVVELANSAAADRFAALLDDARDGADPLSEGLQIEFAVETSEGLAFRVDEENAVHIVDELDETQFLATPPIMWDSAGEQLPVSETATEIDQTDRTRSPAGGDAIEMIDLDLVGSSLVVTPDAEMLASPETVWPVYIDPFISGKGASAWVAVRSGGYNNTLYKWGDMTSGPGQGTGYCSTVGSCNVKFKQRLAWEFSGLSLIGGMTSTDVVSAYFRVNGVHSAYCTAQTTTLQRTSNVSSTNTWSNLTWHETDGTRTEYHRSNCGSVGWRNFSATNLVKWAATNNQSTLRMGLRVNEANINYWKRFRHNATLTVTYNRAPNVPTSPELLNPDVSGCHTGANGGSPIITTTNPTLSAIMSDPDGQNVRASFQIASPSNHENVKWSIDNIPAVASGTRASVTVDSGLVHRYYYAWRSRAYDDSPEGPRYGPWSAWCKFGVDTVAPPGPLVAPVTTGVGAIYLEGEESGGVGQSGAFLLDRGPSGAARSFSYGFNDPTAPSTVDVDLATGTAMVAYTPSTTGPVTLTVKARDRAGNVSVPTTYTFVVASATEDAVWILDEGSGAVAADTFGDPARPLTVSGATWAEGPHGLFDSRDGDFALEFDGVDDAAETSALVLDTAQSFAVSAHVMLDGDSLGQGSFTALSQDGVQHSGFAVQYLPDCAGMPDGCWAFAMPNEAGTGLTTVKSPVPVRADEWTHLVAEFSLTDDDMTLWACSIGTPEDPEPGDPVPASTGRTTAPWSANGGFALGRGLQAGAPTQWWPGSIDNVRVFTGEVVAESKIRRLCQGAEATDFADAEIALDPTTLVGE